MFQEIRSNKASERLNDMIETTAAVERNGIKKEIPIDEIVPGDIVHLAAGDMVPADLMILNAKDLFIAQSAITGESEPVEKTAGFNKDNNVKTSLEANNLCFMGTSVSSGTAKAIVLNTGNNTLFGRIARSIFKKRPKTNFDKGIRNVSLLLLITTVIMVIIVFALQGGLGIGSNRWITSITFSLALAVGLTPELLPMIVTVNLAKEAFQLSKQKIIVKNINSIQSFGAVDVLCTDKTGTLTEDRIILEHHFNIENKEDSRVLIYGYLNSYFQTGLKNLLDLAIIEKTKQIGLDQTANEFIKIDEIPFDFQRRRMSVIIKDLNERNQLITKGALEEILTICDYAEYKGKVVKITSRLRSQVRNNVRALNEQGMRVIAIATNYKPLPVDRPFNVKDEDAMKLVGYVALLDPPKLSARKAILDLQKRGVQVKVLTGDNDAVAKYVCSQVGLKGKKILLGSEIETMTKERLQKKVMSTTIFAKLSPEQKVMVVEAIKNNKHVVGFMGDGINDAAAMRTADLGISVDTAVDVAKESADIILLEKDLTFLGNGCVEGRKTYANIIKYIKMTVSSNFGNMLSMLVASI
jgi:Mg2+-importing ATPase